MEPTIEVDPKQIDEIINRYHGNKEALLMIMQDISDIYSHVPPSVIPILVNRLGVRTSQVYSVATFYKTISVCTGTACHVRGAEKITEALQNKLGIGEDQTTEDRLFTLKAVRCIGCCASGPVITVNQETYGGLDRTAAEKVIDEYRTMSRNGTA